jgi:hypothetical protein
MLKLDLPGLGPLQHSVGFVNGVEAVETGAPLFTQDEFISETKYPLMVRVIPAWIEVAVYSACALICFGSALTTSVKSEDYGLLLVGIAALVGAYGARLIVDVRSQVSVPTWLTFRWKEDSSKPDDLKNRATKFQAQEMAVDIYRIVQWMVMAPLVLFRVYQMAGETGNLFESKGVVTIVALCAVLSYFVLRVGVDELTPPRSVLDNLPENKEQRSTEQVRYMSRRDRERRVQILGVVAGLVGAASYTLLMVDIFNACEKSTLATKTGAEFVAYVSIGYVVVIFITLVIRQCRAPYNAVGSEAADKRGDDGYNENLSVFKDVCYTGLGVAIIGFLAFGSAFDVLEQPFLNTTFFR